MRGVNIGQLSGTLSSLPILVGFGFLNLLFPVFCFVVRSSTMYDIFCPCRLHLPDTTCHVYPYNISDMLLDVTIKHLSVKTKLIKKNIFFSPTGKRPCGHLSTLGVSPSVVCST